VAMLAKNQPMLNQEHLSDRGIACKVGLFHSTVDRCSAANSPFVVLPRSGRAVRPESRKFSCRPIKLNTVQVIGFKEESM